ncbi:MAG: hypothetical protein CSA72_04245 [Rhodobacterales bacterium]|nr:MAG: hypothetical protein CSA72_04245 [Rhodobacterales bacterium]
MVFYLRWAFWLTVFVLFGAFLHYTLPQWDVVRVSDTYEKRVDPGENRWFWAQADVGNDLTQTTRDVFFIQTIRPNNRPMVYRNEDTGWGWPPYFKFDTSNLQAEAADAKSQAGDGEKWFAIKHYGWRIEIMSVFPNAVKIKPVSGPDARVIPWVSIALLILIAMVVWGITSRWLRFKRRRISPTLDRMDAAVDSWWLKLRGKEPKV